MFKSGQTFQLVVRTFFPQRWGKNRKKRKKKEKKEEGKKGEVHKTGEGRGGGEKIQKEKRVREKY